MMIKIGGYLRCSTKKQSSHNGHVSIAMQKKTVYKYLLLIGLVEKMSDIAWYIDEGISGESLDRPDMKRLVNDIKCGRINIVATYDFARISRDVIESNLFTNLVNQYGVRVVCVYDTYNGKTADGRMTANVKFAVNQYEREKDVERTNDGLLSLVEVHHRYPSAIVPYGFKLEDKNIYLKEETAAYVKDAFNMIEDGFSLDDVREYLNTVQTEEHFTNDRISRTLRNIKYSGFLLYKDTLYCDIVPKVVEPSVQAHVIEILDKQRRSVHDESYLLTGLVYCKKCEKRMINVFGTSRNGNRYFYYKCTKCGKYFPQIKLEKLLFEMNLKDLQEKRSKINVSKNIQNLDKRMKTLNDELLGGFIDMVLYKELRDQYTKKKEILEKLLPKKQITTLTAEMSDFERLQFYHMNFDRIIVDCEEKEVVELIYLHKEKKEG